MATNVTPAAEVIYGVKMAVALGDQYPNLSAALVENDFEHNPAPLINVLQNDPAIGNVFFDICRAAEQAFVGLLHDRDELDKNNKHLKEIIGIKEMAIESLTLQNTLQTRTIEATQALTAALRGCQERISKNPDKFTGDEKDWVEKERAYACWKTQIRICFALDDAIFTDDRKKLLFAFSMLDGSAFYNNHIGINCMTANADNPTNWKWATAEDFFKNLDSQYEILGRNRKSSGRGGFQSV